jgi:hypothetical protein
MKIKKVHLAGVIGLLLIAGLVLSPVVNVAAEKSYVVNQAYRYAVMVNNINKMLNNIYIDNSIRFPVNPIVDNSIRFPDDNGSHWIVMR